MRRKKNAETLNDKHQSTTPLKPELLAPAGDFEKLRFALQYGADAVYFGGEQFSLRSAAGNFTIPEITDGVKYCRERGRKAYLTVNIYPHDDDIDRLTVFFHSLCKHAAENPDATGLPSLPDAVIVSDPGVLALMKEIIPGLGESKGGPEIHLSTQANVTSIPAAEFWYGQGVRRLILARELSLTEIAKIHDAIPEDMQLEAFVHGAVCMAYSGRCLLSNYFNGRDSNRGDCSQPCRWNYVIEEAKRPGEYIPIEEDERGTYLLSANDLCMIEHIDDLIKAGVTSFKIEGRMKSAYYVATVTRAYRWAIDASPAYDPIHLAELSKASHRAFSTGFFYGVPGSDHTEEVTIAPDKNTHGVEYIRSYEFLGVVMSYDSASKLAYIEQKNKFSAGDRIELFGPAPEYTEMTVAELYDENMQPIESAPHAGQTVYLKTDVPVYPGDMIRKKHVDHISINGQNEPETYV